MARRRAHRRVVLLMTVDRFAVGETGCSCTCGCTCTISGTIRGCNSLNLPGATITAHDATAGGTVLGTATSAANGSYSISTTGAISGNAIVVVIAYATRFVK